MSFIPRFALFAVLAFLFSPALAQNYVIENLRIPMSAAGPQGLEGLIVHPTGNGPYPLALISHGSPREAQDRAQMMPQDMLPQMMEFARRGFAAATIMRRGYGVSGGDWAEGLGSCDRADYLDAGRASAADLTAAFAALAQRADIDAHHMIAVGVSAGGFATVALTANPPPGLVAAISFAGGRGSRSADKVCDAPALIEAFRTFGQTSRVPMLWVYAENDHFFGPALAAQFEAAFTQAGGTVIFDHAPAFGDDGHHLFSAKGAPIWTPLVDRFLAQENLPRATPLLPPFASPQLTPPPQLSDSGREDFASYLAAFPHKAFAIAEDGSYGWRTARRNAEEARQDALALCAKHTNETCRIYALDDGDAGKDSHVTPGVVQGIHVETWHH